MGSGTYDQEAHVAITTARKTQTREQVFTQTSGCHPEMDPKGVKLRESRDSDNHPDSLGIIFDLDVSSSMDHIPEQMARQELPHFMELTIDVAKVPDPQILFMATGDANHGCDRAPLQVGQYESEEKLIDRWLTLMYLECGGGPVPGESYDLAMLFAARRTSMDCWEKRGRKGYFFQTGDEPPFGDVVPEQVRRVMGGKFDETLTMKKLVAELSKTFHPFFIIPDQHRRTYERQWRDLLGDHVIVAESPEDICVVSATIIGVTEGTLADLDAAAKALQDRKKRPREQVNRIIRAIEPYAASLGRGGERRPAEPVGGPRKRR